MKTKSIKMVIVGVMFLFLLSTFLYAEGEYCNTEGKKNRWSEEKFDKITEELGLTPEQEAKLKEEKGEFREQAKQLREKMTSKRKELKEELEKPTIDRAKVDQIINDIKNLTGEKLEKRVNKIISMKETLTPEQFKKLQDKMEKMHKHHKMGPHGKNSRP